MATLTKRDVLIEASELFLIDETRRIYFKECIYFNNPLAPEAVAYRFYFWDISGKRRKFTFYPDTVGFQEMR